MKIDILYFAGCPNHARTTHRVREVVTRLQVNAAVNEIEVTAGGDPTALKFIGSPTVLIDGVDIDPAQRQTGAYGFGCRTYGGTGLPPVAMIERAIQEGMDSTGGRQGGGADI